MKTGHSCTIVAVTIAIAVSIVPSLFSDGVDAFCSAAGTGLSHARFQQNKSALLEKDSSSAMAEGRYKNRSDLLEHTLRHKLEALKLSDTKLHVLEDAAKRLVRKQAVDRKAAEAELHSAQSALLDSDRKAAKLRDQITKSTAEWETNHKQAKAGRAKAVQEAALLREQLKESQEAGIRQNAKLRRKLQQMEDKCRKDQGYWEKQARNHNKTQQLLAATQKQHNDALPAIQKLKEEVLAVNSRRAAETKQHVHETKDLQQKLEEELERNRRLAARYSSLAEEKQELEVSLDELTKELNIFKSSVADDPPTNTVSDDEQRALQKQQSEHREAMLIAESAVAAATRREQELANRVDELERSVKVLSREKFVLQNQFSKVLATISFDKNAVNAAKLQPQQQQEVDVSKTDRNKERVTRRRPHPSAQPWRRRARGLLNRVPFRLVKDWRQNNGTTL